MDTETKAPDLSGVPEKQKTPAVAIIMYFVAAILIIIGVASHNRATIFGGLIFEFLVYRLSVALKDLPESKKDHLIFVLKKVFGNPWSILFVSLWLVIFIL